MAMLNALSGAGAVAGVAAGSLMVSNDWLRAGIGVAIEGAAVAGAVTATAA